MHVARYWRTKKLRYRLVRIMDRNGSERVRSAMKPQDNSSRDHLPDVKRVKVPS